MNIQDLQTELTAIDQEIAQQENSGAQAMVKKLLNIIERLSGEIMSLEEKLQGLRNEINRLKGEQGKPDIKGNKKKDGDISSETERKEAEAKANEDADSGDGETSGCGGGNKKRHREAKLPKIKIDREQICPLDKEGLPGDLEFKGYEEVVVQNLIITTDNVKYLREIYYSPSKRKSYRGALPQEVRGQGEFGPGIRALIPILKSEGNMSEKRILGFFQNFGIVVSPTYISQQWTGGYELFHQEKNDLYRAGIEHGDYAQIDDTSARVNGVNQYCQIVCNPLFTAYFTTEAKDRQAVLSVLTNSTTPHYCYNQQAQALLHTFNLSDKAYATVEAQLPLDVVMDEDEFKAQLACLDTLGPRQSARLADACAIAYYHQQTDFPVIDTLLADDAPQFKLLTRRMGLCWIHDARFYNKLSPVVPAHQNALADFRGSYWAFYTDLLKYKREPIPEKKCLLAEQFDGLFSTITGYEALDDRISKTRDKKLELLQVLDLPQLPLHNNDAELGARVQARARDVSFQTRSDAGTKIKDTFMTINQTAKKLGVSFYDYIYDRVTQRFELPSLADLIVKKAQTVLT